MRLMDTLYLTKLQPKKSTQLIVSFSHKVPHLPQFWAHTAMPRPFPALRLEQILDPVGQFLEWGMGR